MIGNLIKSLVKVFDPNEKELKKIRPIVNKINELESVISKISDEELSNKTSEFKDRISKGESLDSILPEGFAVVKQDI